MTTWVVGGWDGSMELMAVSPRDIEPSRLFTTPFHSLFK